MGVVEIGQAASGFLNGEGVQGVAFLQVGLFDQDFLLDLSVADVLDVLQEGSFEDLEDHHPPAGDALREGLDGDELLGLVQAADVLLDGLQVEGSTGPGANVWEDILGLHRAVAHYPHFDHLFLGARR